MNKAPRQTLTAPIRRIRFVYVALFFCFWTAAIGLPARMACRWFGMAILLSAQLVSSKERSKWRRVAVFCMTAT